MTTLDEIYAQIPTIACTRRCFRTCGVIPMAESEAKRIARHRLPIVACGSGVHMFDAPLDVCPALRGRDCTIYQDRPLICRLYGVAEGLECRWGCKPERYLTREESHALLNETRRARP